MRYFVVLAIVMLFSVPSLAVHSIDRVGITHVDRDKFNGNRSGPQTYQDGAGGWWLQDGGEDFDGGDLVDTEITENHIELGAVSGPPYLGDWEMIVTNPAPPKRYCHAFSCDWTNEKIVLQGGHYQEDGHRKRDDSWVFDCNTNTWTEVQGNLPPVRSHAMSAYDNHTDKTFLFGGMSTEFKDDTWEFDGLTNTWTEVTTNGKPSGRSIHCLAYDSINRKIVLFGGNHDGDEQGDTWIFDPATNTWSDANANGPSARTGPQMVFDWNLGKMILFGGLDADHHHMGDTWSYDVGTNQWTLLSTSGPCNRDLHTMAYDERLGMATLFGGATKVQGVGVSLNDTWVFDSSTNTWHEVQYVGTSPSVRAGSRFAYDPSGNRTIFYAGASNNVFLEDTWEFRTATYSRQGTYTSPEISLPEGGSWDRLVINASEPGITEISVSLINANTGLCLDGYEEMKTKNIDISSVSLNSIQLRCHFNGDGFETPCLESWNVSWSKEAIPPVYLGGIPSTINVIEDTPRENIVNLSNYFRQGRSDSLTYEIEYISNTVDVHIVENESRLDVTYLRENWTGKVDMIVKCSNAFDQTASSDMFSVIVQGVDDAPIWSSKPSAIDLNEDGTYTSDFSYLDHLLDAENDPLTLSAECNLRNVTVQMSEEGYLTLVPEKDFFGSAIITITARETDNPALKTTVTLELTVNEVNDDPTIKLLSPGDGAVYNDTNISLMWETGDVDTPIGNITFGLYFGDTKSPSLFMSDITDSYMELDELADKSTYYWYIGANDGEGGEATSSTWSFSIDSESEVIPGDTETEAGGLNISIEVDATKIIVEQGNETSFDLEITNDGESPVTLTIVTSGDTAPCLSLNNFITLSPSETSKEVVKVTRTELLKPGNYTISLVFVSPDGMKYVSVPLWIRENLTTTDEPEEEENGEKPGDSTETKVVEKGEDYSWLFIAIGILLLVVILLAVTSLISISTLRSRVNELEQYEHKEEVIEGEAYVPRKTSFQPEIEDRTEIPMSPGPYQPPELPGQSFEPRLATFQSQESSVPQLPTAQLAITPDVSTVPGQEQIGSDMTATNGITPVSPVSEVSKEKIHEALLTPIPPFVQLPLAGGTPTQPEQKMLPENATGAPPPQV